MAAWVGGAAVLEIQITMARKRATPKSSQLAADSGLPPWALTSATVDRPAGGKPQAVWDSNTPETLICFVQNVGGQRDANVTVEIQSGATKVSETLPPGYEIAIQRDRVKRIVIGSSGGGDYANCRFRYEILPAHRRP